MPKDNRVLKMSRQMEEFCELELDNPTLNYKQLAELFNKPYSTCRVWQSSPCYKEYRADKLKERWSANTKKAQKKMLDLIESQDENVALKASTYVLDSQGYKAVEKVELNNNIIKVTLDE